MSLWAMGQQGALDAGGVSHRPWRGDKSLGGSPVFQVRGGGGGGKSAGQAESWLGSDSGLELESLILEQRRLSPGWSMPPPSP